MLNRVFFTITVPDEKQWHQGDSRPTAEDYSEIKKPLSTDPP
jgi:hypothetical protein